MKFSFSRHAPLLLRFVLTSALMFAALPNAAFATQIEIHGPVGSGSFGTRVRLLPNGNIVVTDPEYSAGGIQNIGAVYMFSPTGSLLSRLIGTSAEDRIGNGGVTVLANGNFVVNSYKWDDASIVDVGAVTWGHADRGISGVVSSSNSLVGSQPGDSVGSFGVQALLRNGNYIVASDVWDNGPLQGVGAVTWGNGATGITGPVTPQNSLIGTNSGDQLGYERNRGYAALPLGDGNYLVLSCGRPISSTQVSPGAVTWGDGSRGIAGNISANNSLVGYECPEPPITGGGLITRFFNGDYVVTMPGWDNGTTPDVGAVTWGSGSAGVKGPISPANSLVGSSAGDQIGTRGIRMLSNGNYVIMSRYWDNGSVVNAGASTWVRGGRPIAGTVSPANSLVGTTFGESVGASGLSEVGNGNYVLLDPLFDNGVAFDAGAVTWVNGRLGASGTISTTNSLVGSHGNDRIGTSVGPLLGDTGNYLVSSPGWDNGSIVDAGALTWVDGRTGSTGEISAANSLVGTMDGDGVGAYARLTNGHYAACSNRWDNGAIADVGAVTWSDGRTGSRGHITPSNSLIGTSAGDSVCTSARSLSNGDYVILSVDWDNGAATNAGAVTLLRGGAPTVGTVSASNSLVGSRAEDRVGWGLTQLRNGNFVIRSPFWSTAEFPSVGAVTWVDGIAGLTGVVSADNSLIGSTTNDYVGDVITTFNNGHYLITSSYWGNGTLTKAGALTWADGNTPLSGTVNAENSLIGSSAGDRIGMSYDIPSGSAIPGVSDLKKGYALIHSALLDQDGIVDVGAITWLPTDRPTVGTISPLNSVIGATEDGVYDMYFIHDAVRRRLIVAHSAMNLVTLVELPVLAPHAKSDEDTGSDDVVDANRSPAVDAFAWGMAGKPLHGAINPIGEDHRYPQHPPIGQTSDRQFEPTSGLGDQHLLRRPQLRAPYGAGQVSEPAAD